MAMFLSANSLLSVSVISCAFCCNSWSSYLASASASASSSLAAFEAAAAPRLAACSFALASRSSAAIAWFEPWP